VLKRLGIERRETWIVAWSIGALFCVGWADVSLKNVAETLFLKRVGVEYLPPVFLLNSLLLTGSTWWVGRIVARSRDRVRLLPMILTLLGVSLLPLFGLVGSGVSGVFAALLVASKQISSIALLCFFVAMGDLLDGRQAKRLFAPLTGGVTLGTIAGSFASEPLGRAFGISGLLPIATIALLAGGLLTLPLWRKRSQLQPPVADTMADASSDRVPVSEVWRESRLFRLVFVSVLCSGLLGPMLYFQFSYVADLATQGVEAEQQLLSFYARFRGWIHVVMLIIQLGVSSRLYRWMGVPLAAAISPLIYVVGFAGLSVRMSVPVGIAAMSGTKLVDNAVCDPGLRVLLDLLPGRYRARAMALLEGPIKRGGGAVGNLLVLAAISAGSALWVGRIALPISVIWLVAAIVLWRAYPGLLIDAVDSPRGLPDEGVAVEMLDATTLRQLVRHLRDPSPERCRVAIELVCEGPPQLAAASLAAAARDAPESTRSLLVAALDRVLEVDPVNLAPNARAARDIADLIARDAAPRSRDRADLVHAYARLRRRSATSDGDEVLTMAAEDASRAVRLVARVELDRQTPAAWDSLVGLLADAVSCEDSVVRRTARKEIRGLLLSIAPGEEGELFAPLLNVLADDLDIDEDRAEAAEALAVVAALHGQRVRSVSDAMLAYRDDDDPRIRGAILRFTGCAGLAEHARWLVEQLILDRDPGGVLRHAAHDGLVALGEDATEALLAELSTGRRHARDAILPLVRELHIEANRLRDVYGRELDAVRLKLVQLGVLRDGRVAEVVIQRLHERFDEGLHTLLHLLAAIHDDDRILAVAGRLRSLHSERRHAVLLEALDALLTHREKAELLPLLEDPSQARGSQRAARALGVSLPSSASAAGALLEDPDRLTRYLARATAPSLDGVPLMPEDSDMGSHVERALLLRSLEPFQSLTTRQLVHIAERMREEVHLPETTIVQEGAPLDRLYVVAEGGIEIRRGGATIADLRPGDFFGEIAVFDGAHASPTLAATHEGVRLLGLNREHLIEAMEDVPEIAIRICESLSRRIMHLTKGS
jgi:hypothetical protein